MAPKSATTATSEKPKQKRTVKPRVLWGLFTVVEGKIVKSGEGAPRFTSSSDEIVALMESGVTDVQFIKLTIPVKQRGTPGQ